MVQMLAEKTNLIQSIGFLKNLVRNSSKESQVGENIKIIPFLLDKNSTAEPSFFEVVFIIGDTRYRYGFEVDETKILKEWLFHCRKRETNLFLRTNNNIETSSAFREGTKSVKEKTRDNALFLSVCAQFNGKISTHILNWFNSVQNLFGDYDIDYRNFSLNQVKNNSILKEKMMSLLQRFDIGLLDMQIDEDKIDLDNIPSETQERVRRALHGKIKDNQIIFDRIEAIHPFFDGNKRIGEMSIDWNLESNGTRKLLNISGPIFDTLDKGYILFVDEIDTRLHPFITRELIKLFNSCQTNPNNAQLIFATHDPKLLSGDLLRRDQIWFTEKNSRGASKLYSLFDFKPRNDKNLEKSYMEGRFGGVPYIKNIINSFSEGDCHGEEN